MSLSGLCELRPAAQSLLAACRVLWGERSEFRTLRLSALAGDSPKLGFGGTRNTEPGTAARLRLNRFVGHVGKEKMRLVCRAIAVATGCD